MGIFRDLVSNVSNARMQEEQQKLAYNVGLGNVLTSLIRNESAPQGARAQAASYYVDLLGKHGGKEGKALQTQISSFLNTYLTQQNAAAGGQGGGDQTIQSLPGGTQPQQGQPTSTGTAGPGPGGLPAEQPVPPGQRADQPGGVNYGWDTTAKPSTLAGSGAAGAQGGRTPSAKPEGARGTFGKVLHGLAGAGKEMLGVPSGQQPLLPNAALFGPTGMQAALEKERELEATGDLDRQQYMNRIDEDVRLKRMTPEQGEKAKADYDLYGKAPGSRAERQLSMGQEAFELAKASLAQKLKKNVADLSFDEQRQALAQSVEDSRTVPENRREDNDALDAYAQTLAQKDPNREKTLGRPMTRADLTAQERQDGRMAWAKQKAMRGEAMPTETELYNMVKYDLFSGHTTAMGMSASDPFRRAYIAMRAKIITEEGPGRIADMTAGYRSDQAALTNLQRINDAMTGWEEATKKNLEQVRLLSRQVGRSGSSLWNELQQFYQGKMETYPELTKFRIAVETGVAEYTRVMYSATPSGVTTDDQKKTSRDMLGVGFSEGNVDAAIDQMYTDMRNRKTAMDDQVDRIHFRIERSPTAPAGPPIITDPKDKENLPSGTLYRDPQGNIRKKK